MTVTSTFHMELVNYCFDTRYADIMSSRSGLYPREAFHRLASPQTSFGVRSSRIHFSPTDGFSYERVAQFNLEWIFSKLDSGFQSLVGFRILKPRIPDSRSKKFRDSGVRIPLHGAKSWLSTIYIGKPAGSRFGKMVRTFQDWQIASWNRVYHFYNYKSVPIIEKRPRKPEMQYQRYGFEEMEHEFSSV